MLWHKRLGHISKVTMLRLMKDGLLPNFDFNDYGVCIDCIKGKQTNTNKKATTRSSKLLEIIHKAICGKMVVLVPHFREHYVCDVNSVPMCLEDITSQSTSRKLRFKRIIKILEGPVSSKKDSMCVPTFSGNLDPNQFVI